MSQIIQEDSSTLLCGLITAAAAKGVYEYVQAAKVERANLERYKRESVRFPRSPILGLKTNMKNWDMDEIFSFAIIPHLINLCYPWLLLWCLLLARTQRTQRGAKHLLIISLLVAAGVILYDVFYAEYGVDGTWANMIDLATLPDCLVTLTIGFLTKSILKLAPLTIPFLCKGILKLALYLSDVVAWLMG